MDYPLPPLIDGHIEKLLHGQTEELYKFLDLFGSPLNLIFPQIMARNIRSFRQVMDEAQMPEGRIYFAAKANKANAFLATSAATGAGADVSSMYELRAALGNGVAGEHISVSGPTKPPELLALACVHNARIGIDEPSELDTLVRVAGSLALRHPVRIYLRLASTSEATRFGMDAVTISSVLNKLSELKPAIELDGISFHSPGYQSSDRVHMIKLACEKLIEAAGLGLPAARIDIGGGFRATYASLESWSVQHALARDFMGDVKPTKAYPYASKVAGPQQLQEILAEAQSSLKDTAARLKRSVAIDIEPGRAVLDQAGISVFRVRSVRAIGDRQVVIVDGNSRDLADSFGSEFLVDPLLITKRDVARDVFPAAIASNTCKEDDYLARRFIPLPFKPATGDLLVYVNTAGYEMDSKESMFHRLPIPTKVVATKGATGWRFATDSEFNLADCLELPELSR